VEVQLSTDYWMRRGVRTIFSEDMAVPILGPIAAKMLRDTVIKM
jgi:hypothetical protein